MKMCGTTAQQEVKQNINSQITKANIQGFSIFHPNHVITSKQHRVYQYNIEHRNHKCFLETNSRQISHETTKEEPENKTRCVKI